MSRAQNLLNAHEAMDVDTFVEKVKADFLKQFPKAWIRGGYNKSLGESVSFTFGIQPKDKHQGKIEHNDPARCVISLYGVKDKAFLPQVSVDASSVKLLVKPAEGSHMAYDTVKFGWRAKKDTPEKIAAYLEAYFKKMKTVVDANKHKLAHDIS